MTQATGALSSQSDTMAGERASADSTIANTSAEGRAWRCHFPALATAGLLRHQRSVGTSLTAQTPAVPPGEERLRPSLGQVTGGTDPTAADSDAPWKRPI